MCLISLGVLFATTTASAVTYIKDPLPDTITARLVPAVDCTDSALSAGHIVVPAVTTAADLPQQWQLGIYPNPAHDVFTITTQSVIYSISVTNLLGQNIGVPANYLSASTATLSTAGLPIGIYIVRVNGRSIFRLIKE